MDHPELGVLVDVANFARKVVFDYDGNVPAYPTITITADAPVTNPKIVNGTAFVRLIDELDAGDIVNITTAPQRIRITKNGVNVLNKVDRASNFSGMALQPGTNVVSFAADYGDNNLPCGPAIQQTIPGGVRYAAACSERRLRAGGISAVL